MVTVRAVSNHSQGYHDGSIAAAEVYLRMVTVRGLSTKVLVNLCDCLIWYVQLLDMMICSTADTFSFQEAQWIWKPRAKVEARLEKIKWLPCNYCRHGALARRCYTCWPWIYPWHLSAVDVAEPRCRDSFTARPVPPRPDACASPSGWTGPAE